MNQKRLAFKYVSRCHYTDCYDNLILQVMNNYGKKSNEHLIINYGFMVEGNVNNSFWLKIGVSKKDPMITTKFSLLRKKRLRHVIQIT